MRTIFLVLLLCGNAGKVAPPQMVDRIEINTCHLTEESSFRQAIFWHYHTDLCEYHPRGCVVLTSEKDEPVLSGGMWYVRYLGEHNKVWQACSKTLIYTETSYDPEREDKKRFPVKMRKLMAGCSKPYDWND